MTKMPHMNKPCKDCPFRTDCMKGWLMRERIEQILGDDSFVCHKNTKMQCAGHMLIKGQDNIYVCLAGRLKIKLKLRGKELIFQTEKACIDHHAFTAN